MFRFLNMSLDYTLKLWHQIWREKNNTNQIQQLINFRLLVGGILPIDSDSHSQRLCYTFVGPSSRSLESVSVIARQNTFSGTQIPLKTMKPLPVRWSPLQVHYQSQVPSPGFPNCRTYNSYLMSLALIKRLNLDNPKENTPLKTGRPKPLVCELEMLASR